MLICEGGTLVRSVRFPCLVTPIYKNRLTHAEALRIKFSLTTNRAHQHYFVHPCSLDLSFYKDTYTESIFLPFPKHYFEGIAGYNELMRSPLLYKAFDRKHSHICIVQTDAVLFKDIEGIDYSKYAYIGSSWRYAFRVNLKSLGGGGYIKTRILSRLKPLCEISVGNGGLSIRCVKSFLFLAEVLSMRKYKFEPEDAGWSYVLKKMGFDVMEKSEVDKYLGEHNVTRMKREEIFNLIGVHGIDKVSRELDEYILKWLAEEHELS